METLKRAKTGIISENGAIVRNTVKFSALIHRFIPVEDAVSGSQNDFPEVNWQNFSSLGKGEAGLEVGTDPFFAFNECIQILRRMMKPCCAKVNVQKWSESHESEKTSTIAIYKKGYNPSSFKNKVLLPVFSKIYEKLFILRFNTWLTKYTILSSQRSDSRKYQSTATRV
jgi:hypothetical protein